MKKTREFHDNKSGNISGESIGGAALIRGRRLLTFFSQMQRLFEGGASSRAALIRVNAVVIIAESFNLKNSSCLINVCN